MSVLTSQRRIAKNSYVSSINELSKYAYSRTIVLDIDNKMNKEIQSDIIKYIDVALERSFLSSSIEITQYTGIGECNTKIHYLDQTFEALTVLSKYLAFVLSVMRDRNLWIRKDKEYSMKVFERFSRMINDAQESIDLCKKYLENVKISKLTGNQLVKEYDIENPYKDNTRKHRSKKKCNKQ